MGGVVFATLPVPVLLTTREMVPRIAAKLTFTLAVRAAVVGVKRTVTAWLAPTPARLNGLPETMLKGAEVAAAPEMVPPAVFDTVKV